MTPVRRPRAPVTSVRWLVLTPVVLWVALILFVASRPRAFFFPTNAQSLLGVPRTVVQYPYHVSVFLVLAVLVVWCLAAARVARGRRAEIAAVALGLALSITSEGIQWGVPSRTPAVRDLVLDLSGTLAGLGLLRTRRPQGTAENSPPHLQETRPCAESQDS